MAEQGEWEWMTVAEAARALAIHEVTLRNWIAAGDVVVDRPRAMRVFVSRKWVHDKAEDRKNAKAAKN